MEELSGCTPALETPKPKPQFCKVLQNLTPPELVELFFIPCSGEQILLLYAVSDTDGKLV